MKRQFALKELAALTNAEIVGEDSALISGVADLETATAEDISFLANPRYREAMKSSSAGAICVSKDTPLSAGKNYLICEDPSRAFQAIVETVLSLEHIDYIGIHETAVVHPTAVLGKDVYIGPYAVIDAHVSVGDRTHIGSHVSIGHHTQVGSDCLLHPHSIIRERCTLGNRVILQPGAVIGSCGFGYITDEKGVHHKLQQLGTVILEDDVEIGANTTVDRARFKETRIGKGTKIDNLVQIGHNVVLGPNNIIVSQTGIAGSVKTGKNVIMGGQAGVVGHLEITDNVLIATRGGVSKSITEPGKYAGGPVMPLAEYNRQQVYLRKIAHYVKKLESLEQK